MPLHLYIYVYRIDIKTVNKHDRLLVMTFFDVVDKNIKFVEMKSPNIEDKLNNDTFNETKSKNIHGTLNEVIHDGLSSKGTVDDPDDRKLLRKLDLHLIPGITLLYLINYLDRVNIGQAKLNGVTTSLNLSSAQYNACLSVVYVTYVAFEVPSNLILKKLRPSRWIPLIMVTWGIVTTLTGLANSYGALLACRLLLGAPEAGLFPGKYQLTIRMCSFSEHGNDTSLTKYNQNKRALFRCYLLSVELV